MRKPLGSAHAHYCGTRGMDWGTRGRREKGHRRLLDDRLNQHCPTQFATDVGSRANNYVQNDCMQHPWVQIFMAASKKGDDTGYAFLTSRVVWRDRKGWWCPGCHFCLSGRSGCHTGRTVRADLKSPQTQRDESEAVVGLTIRTMHYDVLSQAH